MKHRTEQETAEARYATQYVPALNYLCSTSRSSKPTRKQLRAFTITVVWPIRLSLSPRLRVEKSSSHHARATAYLRRIKNASEDLAAACEFLKDLERRLLDELPDSPKKLSSDPSRSELAEEDRYFGKGRAITEFGELRQQLERITKFLRGAQSHIGEDDPQDDDWKTELVKELPDLRQAAQAVRVLILMRDEPMLRFMNDRGAQLGQKRNPSLTRDEAERGTTRYIFLPDRLWKLARQAQEGINELLTEFGAWFTAVGSPRKLTRAHIVMGQPLPPGYRELLTPFFDLLFQNRPRVRLGVCEVCGAVFVRKLLDTNRRTCGPACCKNSARKTRAQPFPVIDEFDYVV